MGRVEITTEPIELVIDGTSVSMLGDPSATPEWETLIAIPLSYSNLAERDELRDKLKAALAGLAETPEDGERLTKLVIGCKTAENAARGYVSAVAGFPTRPAKKSGKS